MVWSYRPISFYLKIIPRNEQTYTAWNKERL